MSVQLYIKDNVYGSVHEYGSNRHDSLLLRDDGSIVYQNLQNGDGSEYGGYQFCDKDGSDPRDDNWNGDPLLDIGGMKNPLEDYFGGGVAFLTKSIMIMNKQENRALFITIDQKTGRIEEIRQEDIKVKEQKGKIIQLKRMTESGNFVSPAIIAYIETADTIIDAEDGDDQR